jgi:hypothetical protein
MSTCQARLPIGERPRAVIAENGGVMSIQRYCGQSVGVSDLGWGWFACSKPGHRDDVLTQVRTIELAQRVRHEIEQDARAEALAEVREDDRRAAWLDDEREPVEPVEAWR